MHFYINKKIGDKERKKKLYIMQFLCSIFYFLMIIQAYYNKLFAIFLFYYILFFYYYKCYHAYRCYDPSIVFIILFLPISSLYFLFNFYTTWDEQNTFTTITFFVESIHIRTIVYALYVYLQIYYMLYFYPSKFVTLQWMYYFVHTI